MLFLLIAGGALFIFFFFPPFFLANEIHSTSAFSIGVDPKDVHRSTLTLAAVVAEGAVGALAASWLALAGGSPVVMEGVCSFPRTYFICMVDLANTCSELNHLFAHSAVGLKNVVYHRF